MEGEGKGRGEEGEGEMVGREREKGETLGALLGFSKNPTNLSTTSSYNTVRINRDIGGGKKEKKNRERRGMRERRVER